eukprot:COSAG02_NODE_18845_length_914_cov_3.971779_1_plen_286_part_10
MVMTVRTLLATNITAMTRTTLTHQVFSLRKPAELAATHRSAAWSTTTAGTTRASTVVSARTALGIQSVPAVMDWLQMMRVISAPTIATQILASTVVSARSAMGIQSALALMALRQTMKAISALTTAGTTRAATAVSVRTALGSSRVSVLLASVEHGAIGHRARASSVARTMLPGGTTMVMTVRTLLTTNITAMTRVTLTHQVFSLRKPVELAAAHRSAALNTTTAGTTRASTVVSARTALGIQSVLVQLDWLQMMRVISALTTAGTILASTAVSARTVSATLAVPA